MASKIKQNIINTLLAHGGMTCEQLSKRLNVEKTYIYQAIHSIKRSMKNNSYNITKRKISYKGNGSRIIYNIFRQSSGVRDVTDTLDISTKRQITATKIMFKDLKSASGVKKIVANKAMWNSLIKELLKETVDNYNDQRLSKQVVTIPK